MRYRTEIDGLRAIAVVSVILFHAGFEFFSGGFVGVDVFFVISGYLITTIILAEMQEGKFSLIQFYERRARRILPALFFVMAVCMPFAWMWLAPQDMKDFAQSLVAVTTFSSNILFGIEGGYFDTATELKPLLHTWSLAIEEQYYVFFPLFLMLTLKVGRRWTITTLVLIAGLSLALAQSSAINSPGGAFYSLPDRGWELLIGSFVAFYLSQKKQISGNQLLSFLGLTLIVYSIFFFNKHTPFPSLYTLVPTIGAALIILFTSSHAVVYHLLSQKLLVGIGLISYSAYLWHQPLFVFYRHAPIVETSRTGFILLILLTFFLSYLSWRFIESPFRNKSAICRKRIFAFALSTSAIFFMIGVSGYFKDGFTSRQSAESNSVLKSVQASPKREECHTHVNGFDYRKPNLACVYHNSGATWATFGDSHTVELAYALANELQPKNDGVFHYSSSGCLPEFGIIEIRDPCSLWSEEAASEIINNKNIKNVVVSYRIQAALFGGHETAYPRLANSISAKVRAKRWEAYVRLLQHFVNNGKEVFLVLQAPELPKKNRATYF